MFQDVLKTSWKMKNCYAEDVFKTFSMCLDQDKCLLRKSYLFLRSSCSLEVLLWKSNYYKKISEIKWLSKKIAVLKRKLSWKNNCLENIIAVLIHLLWRSSCSEEVLLLKSSFSVSVAALKKLLHMREGTLPPEKKFFNVYVILF